MRHMDPVEFFLKVFWAVIALAVVIVLTVNLTGCMEGYSDGDRTGVVTKVSRKGVIWKTWECEMNLGGMVNGGKDVGMVANIWAFTVEDEDLLAKVREAQKLGKTVTLEYSQWLVGPAPRTSSGYMVKSVR